MSTSTISKIPVSKVASKGETVEVQFDQTTIDRIARTLAITTITSNQTVGQVLSLEKLQECFRYSLELVLIQGIAEKPGYEMVPTFFTDITLPLRTRYRGVLISPLLKGEVSKRPDSYQDFLEILGSIGVPVAKLAKVLPGSDSQVLSYGLKYFDEEPHIVGVTESPSIEEIVVRAMLTVASQAQEKLDRIIGHADYLYVSRDEICRQWATSLPIARTIRGNA